ncbi:hypothetical protein FACS189443_1020 [Planctomycetales bacterium]|nr:hypothetical protein FACS189443_1020 [Planctomycetales bacterium]
MAKSKGKTFPKLHNAAWPGTVGKGVAGAEPFIDFDTMLRLTADAEVNGVKFDGIDIALGKSHFDLDNIDDEIKRTAEKVAKSNLAIGTIVPAIWSGSAFGDDAARKIFLDEVKKGCQVGAAFRKLGIRPSGCIRIDTASGVELWAKDPEANQKRIVETFTEACHIAADFDEVLACEGEICRGGIHSWRRLLQILETVDRPQTLGFQADMSHTLLYMLGYNAPEDRILPPDFDWNDTAAFDAGYKKLTDALRIWTVDLHIAQNDGSVFGNGTHDKTGRHCLPKDPNGKLDIVKYAGFWLRDQDGLTKRFNHICWDGCMFPNKVMHDPQTWNDILEAMNNVRNEHGWK